MLMQWSCDILEAWIGVYAKLLPIHADSFKGAKRNDILCKGVEIVQRLATRNGPLHVRTSCA